MVTSFPYVLLLAGLRPLAADVAGGGEIDVYVNGPASWSLVARLDDVELPALAVFCS